MNTPLKFMTKVEGYDNVYETILKDAKFIRQNRKFYLLPCEIVDEYKVYQIMPDGRKIRSHHLENWRNERNWDDAEKFILGEPKAYFKKIPK